MFRCAGMSTGDSSRHIICESSYESAQPYELACKVVIDKFRSTGNKVLCFYSQTCFCLEANYNCKL